MRLLLFLVLLASLAGCGSEPRPQPPVSQRVIAGYFTEWSAYGRDYRVRDLDTSGAARRLTHLKYAFGAMTGGRCAVGDDWAAYRRPVAAAESVDGVADLPADPLRGTFGQLRKLKAKYPQLRLLWSFGGWTGSAGFAEAARDPAAFAASCRALLADSRWAGLFDGVDVDWEYPNTCGKACDTSGPDALTRLLAALRTALGPDALISAAVPGDVGKLRAADYAGAARYANWLGAMTYDYFGAGKELRTAPHSALSAYPGIPRETATTEATVTELLNLGVPAEKLLIGIGFYGRGWTGVTGAGPGATATGPAPGRHATGIEDYHVLASRCPPTGTVGGTAYARCGGQWWSYDTPETIAAKVAYARSRSLGGLFAWELSGDTPDARLLTALSS